MEVFKTSSSCFRVDFGNRTFVMAVVTLDYEQPLFFSQSVEREAKKKRPDCEKIGAARSL